VALDLGFADSSHFSRRFRAAYGKTPTQVRRAGAPETRPRSHPDKNPSHAAQRRRPRALKFA
jgi:AraC-like DNA-binding protein